MWVKTSCLLLFLLSECLTTKITRLEVPSEVDLDSEPEELVLDCQYELESDEGLVLTWYFNEKLVYQWIMGAPPTAKEYFKEHLQLGYNVSAVPSEEYRALRLLRPDRTFSGEYTCKVSTFLSEATEKKYLQFFDAGEDLSVTYALADGNDTDSVANDLVEVQCSVQRAFPLPLLTILVDGEEVNQTQSYEEADDEGYNSTATATLPVSELSEGALIRCQLTLPHTSYNNSDHLVYTGGAIHSTEMSLLMLAAVTVMLQFNM